MGHISNVHQSSITYEWNMNVTSYGSHVPPCPICTSHDPQVNESWRMTHSYVRHGPCMWGMWLTYVNTHSYVPHDSFIRETWLTYLNKSWVMTHSRVPPYHIWMSHDPHVNESRPNVNELYSTREWVITHVSYGRYLPPCHVWTSYDPHSHNSFT